MTFGVLLVGVAVIPVTFWPWSVDVFVGPKFDVLRLWVTLAALALGAQLMSHERVGARLRTPDVLVVAYLVLSAIALVLSVDRRTSLFGEPLQQAGFITSVALAVGYAIARISVTSAKRLSLLAGTVALTGAAVAAYGLAQLARIDPVWSSLPNGRVFSTIGQPNWLAAYLVMTVPISFGLMLAARSTTLRVLAAVATLLQITVVIATRGRSGYLGLAIALAVGSLLLIRHLRRGGRIPARAVGASVVGIAAAGSLTIALSQATPEIAPSGLVRRVASTFDVGGFDAGRYIALWEVGAAIAADHPLSGSGQDTYAVMFPEYRDQILEPAYADHFAAFRPESPHNVYLGVAAGTGIPALIAYLGVIGCAFVALVRAIGADGPAAPLAGAILAALVGHLITDFFMTMDLSGSWLFWTLLGVAISLDQIEFARPSPVVAATSVPV